jgi:hypothetical protein
MVRRSAPMPKFSSLCMISGSCAPRSGVTTSLDLEHAGAAAPGAIDVVKGERAGSKAVRWKR